MTLINTVRHGEHLPIFTSNGKTLSNAPHRLGRLQPTPGTTEYRNVQLQLRQDGYVWLKGFLDRQAVLAFRRRVFEGLADAGILAPETDPEEGVYSGREDGDMARRRLMEIVRSAAFESFCLQPRLWEFMDAFVGGQSYLHKRKLLRYTRPGEAHATPAHYDLVYLRGGTDRIVTAWIPIGDIPAEMGGLVYLEGSHAVGRALEREFNQEAGDLAPEERINAYNKKMKAGGMVSDDLPDLAERFDTRWLTADYEAGDVVLHSPYMIHAATSNASPENRIRLSTDIRYQNVRDEIDARWTNHWSLDDML
jgi:ectoine hydroxylase-related dioxygenase (phytanoyl-CoA dioxygenase family)